MKDFKEVKTLLQNIIDKKYPNPCTKLEHVIVFEFAFMLWREYISIGRRWIPGGGVFDGNIIPRIETNTAQPLYARYAGQSDKCSASDKHISLGYPIIRRYNETDITSQHFMHAVTHPKGFFRSIQIVRFLEVNAETQLTINSDYKRAVRAFLYDDTQMRGANLIHNIPEYWFDFVWHQLVISYNSAVDVGGTIFPLRDEPKTWLTFQCIKTVQDKDGLGAHPPCPLLEIPILLAHNRVYLNLVDDTVISQRIDAFFAKFDGVPILGLSDATKADRKQTIKNILGQIRDNLNESGTMFDGREQEIVHESGALSAMFHDRPGVTLKFSTSTEQDRFPLIVCAAALYAELITFDTDNEGTTVSKDLKNAREALFGVEPPAINVEPARSDGGGPAGSNQDLFERIIGYIEEAYKRIYSIHSEYLKNGIVPSTFEDGLEWARCAPLYIEGTTFTKFCGKRCPISNLGLHCQGTETLPIMRITRPKVLRMAPSVTIPILQKTLQMPRMEPSPITASCAGYIAPDTPTDVHFYSAVAGVVEEMVQQDKTGIFGCLVAQGIIDVYNDLGKENVVAEKITDHIWKHLNLSGYNPKTYYAGFSLKLGYSDGGEITIRDTITKNDILRLLTIPDFDKLLNPRVEHPDLHTFGYIRPDELCTFIATRENPLL